jgi:hypothetical protein
MPTIVLFFYDTLVNYITRIPVCVCVCVCVCVYCIYYMYLPTANYDGKTNYTIPSKTNNRVPIKPKNNAAILCNM